MTALHPVRSASWQSDLLANVRGGIELAFFRRTARDRFRSSFSQLILLMAMNVILAIVWGAVLTEAPRTFFMDGLVVIGFWTATVPAFAALAAREAPPGESCAIETAIMLLSPLFASWVAFGCLWILADSVVWVDNLDIQISHLFACWVVLLYAHVLTQSVGIPRYRANSLSAVYGLACFFLVFQNSAGLVAWYTSENYEAGAQAGPAPPPRLDIETILYDQPDLMRASLTNLKPERAGVADVYFLGFASYAKQDVFLKEIDFVREVFDRRFDTEGRSLVLVNHRDTVDSVPIASSTNLRVAIEGLSEIMNPKEDLLVVYLTSHGSKDHELSVRFPRFPLNQVDRETLPQLFDESGIEWPVVIISACYSGGFIPPLEDEKALVLTSAAADRTSFGCGDDSDMTYFARALVEEQLEKTRDMRLAFEGARARLEEWETAEELTPSNPQMFAGEAISARLRDVVSRLEKSEWTSSVAAADQ